MRRYLLVLLGLLQFVAPLVHAHSGNHFAQVGLHLHGLEAHDSTHHHDEPVLHAVDYLFDRDEGAIVEISTGIQNRQHVSDDVPLLYFPPKLFSISLALTSYKINFSPQPRQNIKTPVHAPQSPRAPPV